MHMANRVQKQWTLEEFDRLPDDGNKYELIHGALFVTPPPTVSHETVLARLTRVIDPYVAAHDLGFVFHRGAVRSVRDNTQVEPDLMVRQLPEDPSAGWASPPLPILVVEVASPSTRRRDRVQKREVDMKREIPEYWIVEARDRTVRVVRPGQADFVATETLTWQPAGVEPPLVIALVDVFGPSAGTGSESD
jgi:Uma2 family endonuclease